MKHRNILKIALMLFLAISTNIFFGQTVLEKSDIAIIAISTEQEQFAFVTFKDLEQGTEIFFTDEEADGSLIISTGEGTVQYTAPIGGVLAGTVINGNSNGSAINFSSTTDRSLALGNGGDGILAYQGSLGNVTTFLHAIGKDADDIGVFPTNTLTSNDYLLLGGDDGSYSGITTGRINVLFAAINDATNWTISSSADVNPVSSFTVTASGPTIGFNTAISSQTETDASFNITIPITASGHDGNNIDINIAASGTAELGDYTLNTASLSFTSNSSQNISLDINPDSDDLNDEEIILTLTEISSVAGLVISQAKHIITITEDETPEGPLYNADFTNDDDGFADHTTSLPPADGPAGAGPFGESQNQWSVSYNTAPSSDATANSFKVVLGKLETTDWGGEGIFESQSIDVGQFSTIDISGLAVTLSDNVQNVGTEFFKYYYILDGGTSVETDIILTGDIDGSSVNYSITNLDVSSASTLIVGFAFNCNGGSDGYSISSFKVTASSSSTVTWNGSESSDWSTVANWNTNTVPTTTDNVIVPDVLTAPIIGASTAAVIMDLTIIEPNGLTISSGGSLIVNGTSTGNVTYERTLNFMSGNKNGWHLVTSPVAGQIYNDAYANSNEIATNNTKRGIATYNDASISGGKWSYLEDNDSNAGVFTSGTGYSLKRGSTSGTVSFNGTINTDNVTAAVIASGNGFNLLGNPYTSYINSATFLTDNSSSLVSETIWLWNQDTGNYETQVTGNNFILAPAQGFFVRVDGLTNLNFAETNQTSSANTFQKSTRTEVKLLITDDVNVRFAKISYLNNATTSFDNGYDGETFGGILNNIDVFTQLLSNNQGINYQLQALPNSNYENMVIPIGMNAAAGKEITLSAEVSNLPSDIKVFLEDRLTNTFKQLDEVNSVYKVTLTETLNGIGRFYLHTKSSTTLSNDNFNLANVSIYKTHNSNLRVVGLAQIKSNLKVFNMLGKQAMNIRFTSNGVQDISLPNLASGIYIVQLATENGKLNKKITLE